MIAQPASVNQPVTRLAFCLYDGVHVVVVMAVSREVATLGGGCYWCMEAIFSELTGVEKVESGYAGGTVPNPTYEQVCAGRTGHAEVVQVTFDPTVLSYKDLLRVFFAIHDPTALNRQGADVGTNYRSIILYHNPEQKSQASEVIREITAAAIWDAPIVTQLEPFVAFYRAEQYHQEYFKNNPNQSYCRIVIAPKVQKFREHYMERLKVPASH
jgi:peptide-methionine (S)-S-oxide reductase